MNRKKWLLAASVVLFLVIALIFSVLRGNDKQEENSLLTLTLHGNQLITINVGEEYQELGYDAVDTKEGNLTSLVTVKGTVDSQKPGIYELLYQIKNKQGEMVFKTRYITVESDESILYKQEYDKIDNIKQGWWDGNKHNGERPIQGAGSTIENLKKYDAYYLGNDEKVIYLTFDEGSNETYLKEIVEVLINNDVKATYFLCKKYILMNPDLMKQLVEHGHSVGNHTANHISMPTLANASNFSRYVREIKATEEAFQSVTGVPMDKVYREPKGEWSERSLQIVKDMGYKSYFWSADYLDWGKDTPKETALSEWLRSVHNGAIYLIHPKNKGNLEALDGFIKEMKNRGYRFDLVKNIQS